MHPAKFQFLYRCGVAIAASAVLLLAMTEVGLTDTAVGTCAVSREQYASLSWLQSTVRPMAMLARFCDS